MNSFPKRARRSVARLAVGLVALAVPLVGASAAQGALGTSHTLNTTQLADLVSATALNNSQVDFCFDDNNTSISPVAALNGANWRLGGYKQDVYTPAAGSVSISQPTPHCVRVTYASINGNGFDMSHYAYATVEAGQVKSNQVPGGQNLRDSVPLIQPASQNTNHNGTAGFSTGPDLQTVVDQSGNQMAFLFDQRVNFAGSCPATTPVINPAAFKFVQSSGAVVQGDALFCAVADSPFGTNTAVVQSFPAAQSTATGIWFWVEADSLTAATPADGAGSGDLLNELLTVHNPANSASTTPPTLVSSNLVNGGDSTDVLFNYDKPVNLGNPLMCFINTADSSPIQALSEAQFDADTLQVTFPAGTQNVMEETVQVNDDGGGGANTGGCATSTTPGVISTKGGVKAGGNDGAFSYGYSTGADAQQLTVDRANNRVAVTLDQRINPATIALAQIRLIGPDGSPGASPNSATVPTQGPGPQVLTLQFGAGQIPAGTFGVQLSFGGAFPGGTTAFSTFAAPTVGPTFGPVPNQPQVFALN